MGVADIEIPKITPANTKKEMLEAFQLIKKRIQEQAKAELKPEKTQKERKQKEVVAAAEAAVAQDVVRRVYDLKSEIGTHLNELAVRMEQEREKYHQIQEAIAVKERELQELFEIEKEAFALAALLETQKQKKAEFEQEMQQRREALQDEMTAAKAQWEKEKQARAEEAKAQRQANETLRKREKEEYEYNFSREKSLKELQLQDELTQLEKELHAKREEFEKKNADREAALDQREKAIAAQEQRMQQLEQQVELFPGQLEESIAKAVRETTAKITDDARKNEQLLVKGFEGEKNVLLTKIEALESQVAVQQQQISRMAEQLEKAYGKVQDIAVKAVSATPGRRQERPAAEKAEA